MTVTVMNLLIGILGSNYDRYEERSMELFTRERASILLLYGTSRPWLKLLPFVRLPPKDETDVPSSVVATFGDAVNMLALWIYRNFKGFFDILFQSPNSTCSQNLSIINYRHSIAHSLSHFKYVRAQKYSSALFYVRQ